MRALTHSLLTLAVLTVSASVASVADAHGVYQQHVPNGLVNGCATCHLPGLEHLRNPFGLAVEPLALAMDPPAEWWPAVRELDSDEDGQTNAQELGDPCLTWTVGAAADRTTNISNPGDVMSVSTDPDSCEDPPTEEPGEGGGGAGGGGEGGMANNEPPPQDPPPEPPPEADYDRWDDPDWQRPQPQQGCTTSARSTSARSSPSTGDAGLGWWLVAAGLWIGARRRRSLRS